MEQPTTTTEQSTTTEQTTTNNDLKSKLLDIKENINLDQQEQDQKREQKKERIKSSGGSSYKSKKALEQEKEEFAQSISGVGSFALNMVCLRLPNPIPLSPEESNNFDMLFSKVAFKYSDMLGRYQEETALFAVGLMIIFPRLKNPNEKKKSDIVKKEGLE